MSELDPIDPTQALKLYIADRRSSLAKSSLMSHRSRLTAFVDWLDERDIVNLNELTGRMIKEYQLEGREEYDWTVSTEKSYMVTIRVFVRWCESIEAVESGLSERVQSPVLDENQGVRDVELDSETAQAVLENLERYHYCSREHVTLAVMWHTMGRCGAVRSLDLEDFESKEQYIRFRHRPETDTSLKNKHKSERHIAISEELADLLDEWVENKRLDVTDEYGRRPLITTQHGRISQTTIGIYAYKYTQPCRYAGTCPEGRDPQTCESTEHKNVSTCPASVSPHPFRRGSITHWLRSDVPPRAVSNRADVSEDVIDKHYDERSDQDKMEQRRGYLDNV